MFYILSLMSNVGEKVTGLMAFLVFLVGLLKSDEPESCLSSFGKSFVTTELLLLVSGVSKYL